MHTIPGRRIILVLFLIFLLLPIYWLVNMSFKTNTEIVTTMTLWPNNPTLAHYKRIFTDSSWYSGYINSLKYVIINTVISISFALPALNHKGLPDFEVPPKDARKACNRLRLRGFVAKVGPYAQLTALGMELFADLEETISGGRHA